MNSKHRGIKIKDTERNIYDMYLREGNNRFVNTFKTVLMRDDFNNFLINFKEATAKATGESGGMLTSFIDSLKQSKYVKRLGSDTHNFDERVVRNLFDFYYPVHVFRKNKPEGDVLIYDPMLNFPRLYYSVFYTEVFNKYVPKELYTEDIPSIGAVSPEDASRPKMFQITCDETVGKDELIQYINTFWNEISVFLNKDETYKKERVKASKNFIRDVDIYNFYHELADEAVLRREIETAKVYGVTPENVRKIVEVIRNEHNEINT